MRAKIYLFAAATAFAASAAQADSQSSSTSSNSSSNNGVVRERVIDSYCEGGYCERSVQRRTYRDDRGRFRAPRGWYRDAYGNWYRDRRDDD